MTGSGGESLPTPFRGLTLPSTLFLSLPHFPLTPLLFDVGSWRVLHVDAMCPWPLHLWQLHVCPQSESLRTRWVRRPSTKDTRLRSSRLCHASASGIEDRNLQLGTISYNNIGAGAMPKPTFIQRR